MKILFVSPEVSPIVRTGGLGDVVGTLPIAINGLGADARILCPMHRVCTEIKSKKYLKTTKKNHCKPIHNYYIANPKFKDPLF